jgi:hypothetical protein
MRAHVISGLSNGSQQHYQTDKCGGGSQFCTLSDDEKRRDSGLGSLRRWTLWSLTSADVDYPLRPWMDYRLSRSYLLERPFAPSRWRRTNVNQICALGFAIASALCLSGCSPAARYDYVDGITEGVAHNNADAICRRSGQIAQTNMFIAPSLAYRCVDRNGV